MGVPWIVEAFKAFIRPPHMFYYFSDIFTAAHGVYLFILFILRSNILKLIKKKFNKAEISTRISGRAQVSMQMQPMQSATARVTQLPSK